MCVCYRVKQSSSFCNWDGTTYSSSVNKVLMFTCVRVCVCVCVCVYVCVCLCVYVQLMNECIMYACV